MNDAEDIELNVDVLSQNDETYSSIADIYNVHIFTESVINDFQKEKQSKVSFYKDIESELFISNEIKTDEITNTLFTTQSSFSKKQESIEKNNTDYAEC